LSLRAPTGTWQSLVKSLKYHYYLSFPKPKAVGHRYARSGEAMRIQERAVGI